MFRKYTLLVLAFVLSLFAAEILLRTIPLIRKEYAVSNWRAGRDKDNAYEFKMHHRPSKYLGYEPVPHSGPQINSMGMFDREYKLKKAKDVLRIVFIGDSITAHGIYTSLLEDKLQTQIPNKKIEVWNCGVGGYNLKQYHNYLKYKAVKYDPDLVVIAFCLNDLSFDIPVLFADGDGYAEYYSSYIDSAPRMIQVLFKHSYLFRYLIINIRQNFLKAEKTEEAMQTVMSDIRLIAEKEGFDLSAVVFPYIKPYSEYLDLEKENYQTILTGLRELDIDHVDLRSSLEAEFVLEDINTFRRHPQQGDYSHFSPRAEFIIAELLSDYFLKKLKRYKRK